MNSTITKLGGAFAVYVTKVGVATALANPATWVVAGTVLAVAAIYDAVQDARL